VVVGAVGGLWRLELSRCAAVSVEERREGWLEADEDDEDEDEPGRSRRTLSASHSPATCTNHGCEHSTPSHSPPRPTHPLTRPVPVLPLLLLLLLPLLVVPISRPIHRTRTRPCPRTQSGFGYTGGRSRCFPFWQGPSPLTLSLALLPGSVSTDAPPRSPTH